MKKVFAPSLVLAGLVLAGTAQANPYGHWQSSVSDDDKIKIADSFNSTASSAYSEDNDVAVDVTKTRTEDNDITTSYKASEDNDISSWYRSSEDNDISSYYSHAEDNDVTEDNDYTHTEDNDTSLDLDLQIATPTLTSYKQQSQDAGHEADTTVLGSASGHNVGVRGGPVVVSAGNDEQTFFGPAMINNNTNQLPQNNLFVQGSNMAPISQSNTFAGRDMGNKGVFAPIGNTSAAVSGNVGQSSGARVGQSGDSSNRIADSMSGNVSK